MNKYDTGNGFRKERHQPKLHDGAFRQYPGEETRNSYL